MKNPVFDTKADLRGWTLTVTQGRRKPWKAEVQRVIWGRHRARVSILPADFNRRPPDCVRKGTNPPTYVEVFETECERIDGGYRWKEGTDVFILSSPSS
jgi:hypothetical protein